MVKSFDEGLIPNFAETLRTKNIFNPWFYSFISTWLKLLLYFLLLYLRDFNFGFIFFFYLCDFNFDYIFFFYLSMWLQFWFHFTLLSLRDFNFGCIFFFYLFVTSIWFYFFLLSLSDFLFIDSTHCLFSLSSILELFFRECWQIPFLNLILLVCTNIFIFIFG